VRTLLAIIGGAVLLIWPALLNGYPLVFIDTVSYLNQTTVPELPWDKTLVYGLFLHLFHWQVTLWPVVVAQGLLASHLLWLAQRSLRGEASERAHVGLCLVTAALTSAPWFLAMLMPDAFTGIAPLCLLLLGLGRLSRGEMAWVAVVGALAVTVHLSHLPTALTLLVFIGLVTRRVRPVFRTGAPIVLAVAFLLAGNALAFGRATLSPHGSVFLLARLQADGPATATLREHCPVASWHLCAFTDRLPMDSDEFLWGGGSPLNRNADGSARPMGGVAGSAEAREILATTLRERPGEVAAAMLHNMLTQLLRPRVGDTLTNTDLALSVRRPIAAAFPPAELAAFDAGAQMRGALPGRAAPFLIPHLPVLLLALLAAPALTWRALRAGDVVHAAFIAGTLLALLANAATTGALSGPHDRYQARITWLLPLSVMLALLPRINAASAPRRLG
jgi:hypothetical protein